MKYNKYILSMAICATLGFSACKNKSASENQTTSDVVVAPAPTDSMEISPEKHLEISEKLIKDYVSAHKMDTNMTNTGLVYHISKKNAKGLKIKFMDEVTVKYRGTLLNGEQFDAGEIPFTAGAQQVIRGWDEGIQLMREGEKMTLIIPWYQAYGNQGNGPIPAYSDLVFEMEVIKVIPGKN